eukprot:1460946-Rhodomonas_salina.1
MARVTRSTSVSAPPAAAIELARHARCGPSGLRPAAPPSIVSSSPVIVALSADDIANPSARAFARSNDAPTTRMFVAWGSSSGVPSRARPTDHPLGESCTARRCASAAASDTGSEGEIKVRAACEAVAISL